MTCAQKLTSVPEHSNGRSSREQSIRAAKRLQLRYHLCRSVNDFLSIHAAAWPGPRCVARPFSNISQEASPFASSPGSNTKAIACMSPKQSNCANFSAAVRWPCFDGCSRVQRKAAIGLLDSRMDLPPHRPIEDQPCQNVGGVFTQSTLASVSPRFLYLWGNTDSKLKLSPSSNSTDCWSTTSSMLPVRTKPNS
jgi:hypothetical protein